MANASQVYICVQITFKKIIYHTFLYILKILQRKKIDVHFFRGQAGNSLYTF